MKAVYAALAHFEAPAGGSSTEGWRLACEWLSGRGLAPGADEVSGSLISDDGTQTVTWRSVDVGPASVRRLIHEVAGDDHEPGWETHIWVCSDGTRSWGIVRSGPQSVPGIVTTLRYDAHRPALVGLWLDEMVVTRDRHRLGQRALNLGQGDTDWLVALLLAPDRQLPVVGISKTAHDGATRALLDVRSMAYRLAGNAHVVVIDPRLSWNLTDVLGKPLSVFDGGVRIWWPSMTTDDDPYRHTLVTATRIVEDAMRAENMLVRRIWNAAIDAVGPPPLEARLLATRDAEVTEERIAELRSRAADSQEWEALLQSQMENNTVLLDKVDELEASLEDLREALERAQVGAEPASDDELEEVDSVLDAVKKAQVEATRVVYLQSALDAARESQYPNPQQVLKDLRALDRVASLWAKGELPGGFDAAFSEEPVLFKRGIGQIAATKYRSDYEIDYAGRKVLMEPHLRRGVGAPTAIFRAYWYVDEGAKQFVVGHVGKKLRDVSNS